MKKLCCMLLALLLCGCAFAEEAAFVQGGNGAKVGSEYYIDICEGRNDALVRIMASGAVDVPLRADELSDMIAVDNSLYFLMKKGDTWSLMCNSGEGAQEVCAFDEGKHVSSLGARDGLLFVLIDGRLHIIYPKNSMYIQLAGVNMEEYVVHDDYAYFVSGDDKVTYMLATKSGDIASAETGRLCRVNLTTGKHEVILDEGVSDLGYADGRIYYHCYEDGYLMGTGEEMTVEGRLYCMDIASGKTEKLTDYYDWDYYVADDSVCVLRREVIVALGSDGMETIVCVVPRVVEIACTGEEYVVFDANSMGFGILGK